ncbi:MAG: DUF1080 domain-containing protein [Planctomycetota bacterium]|nr:DUF1080 domain-containing protein [Planctomycetota bacterium]
MKSRSLFARLKSVVRFALLAGLFAAAPQYVAAETYTSQKKAGVSYKLQGEYLGVVESWGGSWGAQVIAVSEKKLAIHLLDGGLPGQGAKGAVPAKKYEANIDVSKEVADVTKDAVALSVQPTTIDIRDEQGKVLGVLTKIVRESKTLGAQPPKDAVVLFDAIRVNDFNGNKMGEDGLLGVGGTSKELFGDHRMHIEFRTPFQPDDSGQGRGNSGVYIQGRYELQVLDSFGLSGENNECGGIYQIAKPSTNMCYPPLTWQTYDIEFKAATYDASGKKISNAKLSVKHNGVTIHDGLDLPKGTPGKDPEADSRGPLFLQDHGNPVTFRNIWVQRTGK